MLLEHFAAQYDESSVEATPNAEPSQIVAGIWAGLEAHHSAAIARGRVDADVYYGRGTARLWLGNCAGAEADLTAAIERGRDDADVYYGRGTARFRLESWAGAEADLTAAIERGWVDADVYYGRGTARLWLESWAGAEADLTAAIERRWEGGTSRFTQGNRVDFTMPITRGRVDADVYYWRGLARRRQGNWTGAEADYSEAIRLTPKYAWTYNSRAWLWATCPDDRYRNGKRAVESATRACKLTKWKEVFPLGTLAAAYAESGDFDAAVKCQEKAQAMYLDDKDREKGLARLELYKAHRPYREQPRTAAAHHAK